MHARRACCIYACTFSGRERVSIASHRITTGRDEITARLASPFRLISRTSPPLSVCVCSVSRLLLCSPTPVLLVLFVLLGTEVGDAGWAAACMCMMVHCTMRPAPVRICSMDLVNAHMGGCISLPLCILSRMVQSREFRLHVNSSHSLQLLRLLALDTGLRALGARTRSLTAMFWTSVMCGTEESKKKGESVRWAKQDGTSSARAGRLLRGIRGASTSRL